MQASQNWSLSSSKDQTCCVYIVGDLRNWGFCLSTRSFRCWTLSI